MKYLNLNSTCIDKIIKSSFNFFTGNHCDRCLLCFRTICDTKIKHAKNDRKNEEYIKPIIKFSWYIG